MRGLDPRIHEAPPRSDDLQVLSVSTGIMDCRAKPGNDNHNGHVTY